MDVAHDFKVARLGVVILNHDGNHFEYSVQMDFQVTNNVAEYEALIFRVIISKKVGVNNIIIRSDSRLVLSQYMSAFEANDSKMRRHVECLKKECVGIIE